MTCGTAVATGNVYPGGVSAGTIAWGIALGLILFFLILIIVGLIIGAFAAPGVSSWMNRYS